MHRALFVVAAIFAVTTACGVSIDLDGAGVRGSGDRATTRRSVEPFDRIEIGGNVDADVTVGGATAVTIAGDDNLLPLVETFVRRGTLHVRPSEKLRPRAGISVTIATPSLEAVSVGGSGDVRVRRVRSRAFEAGVHGSASLVADGAFGDLTAGVSGSGRMALSGSAERVDARVSGSGDVDLLALRARSARVRVSGSGGVAVEATESLDAEVSGSGHVRYAGGPSVRSHVSGSGSVRPTSPR